jgi:hypothetical protein
MVGLAAQCGCVMIASHPAAREVPPAENPA